MKRIVIISCLIISFTLSCSFFGSDSKGRQVEEIIYSLSLTDSGYEMSRFQTYQATVEITPSNDDLDIQWVSSDSNIFTVDSAGLVTAHNRGSASLTAVGPDGVQTEPCQIYVKSGIQLNPQNIELHPGGTYQLNAAFIEGVSPEALQWISHDDTIVSVDQNGLVSAISPGTAQISVNTADDIYGDSCIVETVSIDHIIETVWEPLVLLFTAAMNLDVSGEGFAGELTAGLDGFTSITDFTDYTVPNSNIMINGTDFYIKVVRNHPNYDAEISGTLNYSNASFTTVVFDCTAQIVSNAQADDIESIVYGGTLVVDGQTFNLP